MNSFWAIMCARCLYPVNDYKLELNTIDFANWYFIWFSVYLLLVEMDRKIRDFIRSRIQFLWLMGEKTVSKIFIFSCKLMHLAHRLLTYFLYEENETFILLPTSSLNLAKAWPWIDLCFYLLFQSLFLFSLFSAIIKSD